MTVVLNSVYLHGLPVRVNCYKSVELQFLNADAGLFQVYVL